MILSAATFEGSLAWLTKIYNFRTIKILVLCFLGEKMSILKKIRDFEHKQAMVNIIHAYSGKVFNIDTEEMILQNAMLQVISQRRSEKKRIAFFAPEDTFVGNFGDIPVLLEELGHDVIWLYGQPSRFLTEVQKNSFLIVDDMMRHVKKH